MPVKPSIDPAVFDSAQFEMVRRMISTERLRIHLHELDRQVSALTGSAGESIEGQAHKIVSQAGMVGLRRLSDRARALEEACGTGAPIPAALLACRAAAGDVRRYAMPAIGAVTG